MGGPLDPEELAAVAWDMTGALGLTCIVKGSDIVIDPDELDEWWARHREHVMPAFRQRQGIWCRTCGGCGWVGARTDHEHPSCGCPCRLCANDWEAKS